VSAWISLSDHDSTIWLTTTEQEADEMVAVELNSLNELATRHVIPRELRPLRVPLEAPGNVTVGPWTIRGATASADQTGIPDLPAAPPIREGVVSRSALHGRLAEAERVVQISAPAGSGKTALLRSWIAEARLTRHAAWVPVHGGQRDPRRFWMSVADALRGTTAGSALVRPLTGEPDLDGWAVVERLLKDLARLEDRLWLVIDDAHLLDSGELRPQLELLVLRAPPELRVILATRHDLRLGLHRLRLEGELTEIRTDDLRFSLAEARALFDATGVELSAEALALLHRRTEGWAAGLRLAALSLAGHPDPEGFAAEFSGSERTVVEYLLAEVLERQSEQARRLLLRTSVLERVNGELADLLSGGTGGERVLQDLEAANAFVVALSPARSWFRYHHLFADLLQRELRRTAPGEVIALHQAAANWFAARQFPVEATWHAQEAQDWGLAARLLADHWLGLHLDAQAATVHPLLARFPADVIAADAELAAVMAADHLAQGSLALAEQRLRLATRESGSVPTARRARVQLLLGVVRLLIARQRGNLPAVAEEAGRLQAMAEDRDAMLRGLGEQVRALALITLGVAEYWAARFDQAEPHLEQGVALARRVGRPYLEFTGLAHQAGIDTLRSHARAAERGRQAVGLALRHGWTDEPVAGTAYQILANVLAWQGRPEEAEGWLRRAERALASLGETEPATGAEVCYVRGLVELTRGRDHEAVTSFLGAELLAGQRDTPHLLLPRVRGLLVQALVRMGKTEQAERTLASLGEREREHGEIRIAAAALRLAQDNAPAATTALAPVLDGSAPVNRRTWLVQALMLEGSARDALGDPSAAEQAVQRGLDLAEPDRALSAFLIQPAPDLLQRHARQHPKHAPLIADILRLLPGEPTVPAGNEGSTGEWQHDPSPAARGPRRGAPYGLAGQTEPLSRGEIRVLRYLPTNLSAREIARDLSVSVNTVRTHMRHLFAKLNVHRRTEAVTQARALGLLAPSALSTATEKCG
jgi:LuxR family transcriptional regulator, maltose regulon positive regulatory protein